jgi:hypothetical protein
VEPAQNEKRRFPRIPVDCPILYRSEENNNWSLATVLDFSAAGFSMVCERDIAPDSRLLFEINTESNKTIPSLNGIAHVVRSIQNEKGNYCVSCKFVKIRQNKD